MVPISANMRGKTAREKRLVNKTKLQPGCNFSELLVPSTYGVEYNDRNR